MKKMLVFFAVLIVLAMLPAQALAQDPTLDYRSQNEWGWSPDNPFTGQYNYYSYRFMLNSNMATACRNMYSYNCTGYTATSYDAFYWGRMALRMGYQWEEQGYASYPPVIDW